MATPSDPVRNALWYVPADLLEASRDLPPPAPELDGAGRLLYGGRWVALSPTEERLAAPLVRGFDHVVRTAVLREAGWGEAAPNEDSCRTSVRRLRRRCRSIGLELDTVWGRGYLLHRAGDDDQEPPSG